ncbi:MAG: FHA domain-containing protein [Anaerolineae bacterium]|nr:FHA domain-containing protein [Anaerolineae bacterium]
MPTPQAYLTDLQGQVIARVTPSELVTFGQNASNTVVLDDFSVSPQHGAIAFRGDRFIVERWSRGAIWLNDAPVEGSHPLQDNDRLLVGKRHAFIFRLGAPAGEALPPDLPSSVPEMTALPAAPDWARAAGLEADEETPPDDIGDEAEPGPEVSSASGQADQESFADTAEAEAASMDAGDEPAGPPVPVPGWAAPPGPTETIGDPKITPPEGMSAVPEGWHQELQATPPPAAAPTLTGGDIWDVRDRSEARRLIQDAIRILQYGDTERARQKLNQALRINESNEDAWLWLAAAERDPERRRGALQRALTINPNNLTAKWGIISLQTLDFSGSLGAPPSAAPTQYTPPAYQPPPTVSPGESIPALLRAERPVENPGMAMLARFLCVAGVLMLGAALFMEYGVWTLSATIRLWIDIPPADTLWTGLQTWGYLGIAIIAVVLILMLLIRARQQRWLGALLTVIGLGVIFMGLFPPLFAVITDLQLGAVVWGAAGLPLMLGGLLKIW